jgi:MATE family multidrug resistance protein
VSIPIHPVFEPERSESIPRSTALPSPGGLRQVVNLALPLMLTHLSITLMGVVDSAMVGRLGATELAAVGFGGAWLWTLFNGFIGAGSVVQTFVAQNHGAARPEECGKWAWQGLYALIPLTACGALILYFNVDSLMSLLAPSTEIQRLAGDYLAICAFGAIGMCAATILSSFFVGIGDSRTPLYVTLFVNVLNAALDYALIFGKFGMPAWGVSGAAVATSLSEGIYALVLCVLFLRRRKLQAFATSLVPPRMESMRRLLRTGLPVGGQYAIEMLSFAAFLTLVARMGDASMAASQVFIALLSISFMQAEGLGIAVCTLVGRYVGHMDRAGAARSFRSGQLLTLVISSGVALLFVVFPTPLVRIFSDDPEVLRLARPLLMIGAIYQFFDAFAIVADGALRGAGDTLVPFLIRVGLAWGLFLPLAWLLGIRLEGGLSAAWVGGALYVTVLAGILVVRFRSGAWRKIRI